MTKAVKTGDKVKLIDSGLAGVCYSIVSSDTIIIKTSDGLLIPVLKSEVIVSDPEANLDLSSVSGKGKKDKRHSAGKGKMKAARHEEESKRKNSFPAEIDLHMNVKPTMGAGPSPEDIVSIQIDKFTNALKRAIADRKTELIVIHGEGSGRLKDEIRKLIKNLYPQFLFMDAPFHKYGRGATRIMLK